MNEHRFYGVFYHHEFAAIAKEFWQHAGMGISSRFADAVLVAKDITGMAENDLVVKKILKTRIASYVNSDHVYLFPSGMHLKVRKRYGCRISGFEIGLEALSGSENGAVWVSVR
jgi:hypothetical protein